MWCPDHPRACGANLDVYRADGKLFGSSPRMRGKPIIFPMIFLLSRIIPAHAGQTKATSSRSASSPDHPRACGANWFPPRKRAGSSGSSPRMRGKRWLVRVWGEAERIIPAHAGQTGRESSRRPLRPDHPRACGANMTGRTRTLHVNGSSPRMRGKQGTGWTSRVGLRIIPAHAGQTSTTVRCDPSCADHPRACGANSLSALWRPALCGSSPRMRGKRCRRAPRWVRCRIIPAHAGQTPADNPVGRLGADHPRACGANVVINLDECYRVGSSPRMRGKLGLRIRLAWCVRIIPAHAGQTGCQHAGACRIADHPRACGANALQERLTATRIGSSPRMRGKLGQRLLDQRGQGIIPAHAGQTSGSVAGVRIPAGSSPRMRGKLLRRQELKVFGRIIPAHAGQTHTGRPATADSPDHPRACGANVCGTSA